MKASDDSRLSALFLASRLMSYPDAGWRTELPSLADAVRALPGGVVRDALASFIASAEAADAGSFEERYVRLFDMGGSTNLYLTGRNRADAASQRADMIAYSVHYEAAGYEPDGETPDYLPALLELASCIGEAGAKGAFRTAERDLEELRVSLANAEATDYEGLVVAVQRIAAGFEEGAEQCLG